MQNDAIVTQYIIINTETVTCEVWGPVVGFLRCDMYSHRDISQALLDTHHKSYKSY